MASPSVTQIYFVEIHSVPAAAVFAALYFVFLVGFAVQVARLKSRVSQILTLFCATRLTSFVLRGVIAGSIVVNIGLLVGEEILFGVGLFFLLNAVCCLVHHREAVYCRCTFNVCRSGWTAPQGPLCPYFPYRILLLVAVVLGSVATSQLYTYSDSSTISYGHSLQLASAILFLALVLVLAYPVVVLSRTERNGEGYKDARNSFGVRFGAYILMMIVLLLFVRQAYATATARDRIRANNEHLWYPLLALPELLVVMLFLVPGLVPSYAEVFLSEPFVILEKTLVAPAPIIPAPSFQPQGLVNGHSRLYLYPQLPSAGDSSVPQSSDVPSLAVGEPRAP